MLTKEFRVKSRLLSINKLSIAALTLTTGVLLVASLILMSARPADAAPVTDFNAGNIIDDAVFYNKDAMSAQQIQSFLNKLIPNCDVNGSQPSEYGGGTRAQYAKSVGWPGPPYPCLNVYHENPNTGETSYEKGGGAFSGGISAARIIYNAAQQYGINPRVLLVFLKKESAGPLTADKWPLKSQYKYAMGYACPDSGGANNKALCDQSKAGFYKQVMLAAWQLKYYKDHPNDYRYHLGVNQIQYSPDTSCGTKTVNIQNMATLSLYIYTPYTPNNAALANYPGTAPCGAYGNRNFYAFYKEWFGTTRGNWPSLDDPRRMVTNKATYKINPFTGEEIQALEAGRVILFSTKIDNCLRTSHDTASRNDACVKREDLSEFTPTLEDISQEENKMLISSQLGFTYKIDFIRDKLLGSSSLYNTQLITFAKKTVVAGDTYYITQSDLNHNILSRGVRSDRVKTITDAYTPFLSPRYAHLKKDTNVIDTSTQQQTDTKLNANTHLYFNKKIGISKKTYYLSDSLTSSNEYYGVEASNIVDGAKYTSFVKPRAMKLTSDAHKLSLDSNTNTDSLTAGMTIHFSQKVNIDGKTYYRTSYDANHGRNKVIDATLLAEAN